MAQQSIDLVKLCPWWAKYFRRGDGEWMAYCSKAACEEMEQDRPGWRERVEGEFQEECMLGWGEELAESMPGIIIAASLRHPTNSEDGVLGRWFKHLRGFELPHRVMVHLMTDDLWQKYIDAFMEWEP